MGSEIVVVVVVAATVTINSAVFMSMFGDMNTGSNGGTPNSAIQRNPVGADTQSATVTVVKVVFFRESVLVVVHPHFENPSFDANLVAELHNHFIVALLHLPPNFVGELMHLLLLFLGELRSEAFTRVVVRRRRRAGVFPRDGEATAAGEGEEHVGGGGVGGDRRRGGGVRTPVRRGRRRRVMAVVGLVL